MRQKIYCAIIGDINRSRSLPDRAKVQRRFAASIAKINTEFKGAIAAKFLITLGDEFQGLLAAPEVSYDLVRRFEDLMKPVPFAFGIGIGTISTPLRKESLGMDGQAFHRARNAIQQAKHKGRTMCYSFDGETELLVNGLVALMDKLWLRLTHRQQLIARLLQEGSQKDVARRLRVTPQVISKTKRSATIGELDEAAQALRHFLSQFNHP